MIEVSRLHKSYGNRVAVRDLSFSVQRGEVVGFLGPNGAGKSTTLRILAGFLAPTSGDVRVCGHDVTTDSLRARESIGYMPEASPLYPEMRVVEYLRFRAELKGVARTRRRAAVHESMERASVTDVANVPIGKLSKGYRQRVGLADALVARPKLLLLDEPTAGLDPNQIREVRGVLAEVAKESTVLVSTHILAEVEATCTRAVVVARGRLVAEGPLDTLLAGGEGGREVVFRVRGARTDVDAVLTAAGARARTEPETSDVVRVTYRPEGKAVGVDGEIEALVAAFVARGLGVRSVERRASNLEEVFAELTRETP
ncbi:MAG: ABC transporter ATP-binding protein [Polyangiaceae bacterium]